MKEIELTRGFKAIVSDEDFPIVSQRKWTTAESKPGVFYAKSSTAGENQKRKTIYLHRLILNAPKSLKVDHKNGNTLDNTRENLRLATNSQNSMNRRKTKNKTGYKGVFFTKHKRYRASLVQNYQTHRLGVFSTAIEAAKAYDAKAKELFGEFANLNFPERVI